jgi:hypothetical protein
MAKREIPASIQLRMFRLANTRITTAGPQTSRRVAQIDRKQWPEKEKESTFGGHYSNSNGRDVLVGHRTCTPVPRTGCWEFVSQAWGYTNGWHAHVTSAPTVAWLVGYACHLDHACGNPPRPNTQCQQIEVSRTVTVSTSKTHGNPTQ